MISIGSTTSVSLGQGVSQMGDVSLRRRLTHKCLHRPVSAGWGTRLSWQVEKMESLQDLIFGWVGVADESEARAWI